MKVDRYFSRCLTECVIQYGMSAPFLMGRNFSHAAMPSATLKFISERFLRPLWFILTMRHPSYDHTLCLYALST